ncbi:hypothetical protein [Flaviaesturariibacter terrae]
MNWKLCLSVSATLLLGLLPQNGVSCAGGDEHPQDYFTSFFSRSASGADPSYRPFFYSMVRPFYDSDEETDPAAAVNVPVLEEWQRYCGNARRKDVEELVLRSTRPELAEIREALGKEKLPAAWQDNSAATALLRQHNTEAVEYLQLAKEIEGLTLASSEWEAPARDSATLVRRMEAAQMAGSVSRNDFLKPRWAFLSCKAAFYAHRYAECIRFYDAAFANGSSSAVQPLALSYKGGALFRTGRNKEAAYAFSRAFAATRSNRRGNFLGFLWSTHYADSSLRDAWVAQGRNDREKADMTGLFSLYGDAPALRGMQQVYRLDPSSPLLPLIASREVSKVEEKYLTPLLGRSTSFEDPKIPLSRELAAGRAMASALARQLKRYGADANLSNRAFYTSAAAYMYLLDKQYDSSRRLLTLAETLRPNAAQQDQLKMLQLLLAANEPARLGPAEEAALLPAAAWLARQAKKDPEYAAFERDFYSQLLATRYARSPARRALVISVADSAGRGARGYYYDRRGFEVLHNDLSAAETQQLYTLMNSPATAWERQLAQHASFSRNDVIETLGTAYLREGNYAKAIEWLQRADSLPKMQGYRYDEDYNETRINTDPFHDYLNDWQRYERNIPKAYTKLSFAQRMKELHDKAATMKDPDSLAQVAYRLGSAYYNMSQYGNAWMAVSWSRGSSDWNEGKYDMAWQKDFFAVYRARQWYEQAFKAARNREFKAACYFMIVKCAQKQLPRPSWNYDIGYQEMEKREAAFQVRFRNNPLFPGFVKDFGDTKFYQYTYKRCSYLRDFVRQQQGRK